VLEFARDEVCRRVVPQVVQGRKAIALAVTEPTGGSDVAAVRTTARLEPDGRHYVVSGSKKFITAGTKASWFTTAVRTGGEGVGGISLLLIDRALPGIEVRRLPTTGWWTSGTTLVTFDKVRVPAECLLGREGRGFGIIMRNFNHERFVGCVGSNRYARLCVEQSVAFARQRRTFGRRLADHQAIRHKIAEMAMRVESTHALIEQIAYRMQNKAPARELGGQLALCKVLSTRTMSYCANQAGQIFGGNAFVRGGKGAVVERVYREVRVNAVGGGSEEILLDLATRQAVSKARKIKARL
jgi:alkylation response protein AidB-like acyl-CoA dehydrogenase